MSLTGRFSAFFLSALALVLIVFSTVLYVSARIYLDHRVTDRLDAALAVLAAAAEIHPDGVEWEPQERVLPLGQEPGPERLRWIVFDDKGDRVDHSRNLVDDDLTADWLPRAGGAHMPSRLVDRPGRTWQIAQRTLRPDLAPRSGSRAASDARPKSSESGEHSETLYPLLVLTVCAPLQPNEATVATLGYLLVILSAGTWLLAALVCRRLSRRALAPVTRMVESARGLNVADPGWSLELSGTGDELEDLGLAFNGLLARLHVAYQQQRRFSSDASHQLRTPLAILIGQIEVALRHDRSGEEYRRVLRLALGRADHLRQIVETLLFLGRADSEAQLLDCAVLDLEHWTARHIADRPAANAGTECIIHSSSDEPIPVRAHPALLAQMLDNLLDNAVKYGRPGSSVVVETLPDRENGHGILAVQDFGAGIPADEIARVFEPFYRAEQERRQGVPGVGLGLAIVQRIATACGGTTSLRSTVGVGSRFEVRLPIASSDHASRRDEIIVGPTQQIVMS